jgi:hypothetical protein
MSVTYQKRKVYHTKMKRVPYAVAAATLTEPIRGELKCKGEI